MVQETVKKTEKLKLPCVYSNGAMFQAGSKLTVNGIAAPGERVRGEIRKGREIVSAGSAMVGADGRFALTLTTPVPSFAEHTLIIETAYDCRRIENVLFGELWIASGQSNMEMPNAFIADRERMMDLVRGKKIRVFHVDHLPGNGDFPWEPDPFVNGYWIGSDDRDRLMGVSAMALKFAQVIYDFLNPSGSERKGIPFGFANVSYGGTPITAWLPRNEMLADSTLRAHLERINNIQDRDSWNTRGDLNFQQPCCQYNAKIAPIFGLRFRGIIWYQGENECGGERILHSYADYLRFLHRHYSSIFAADPSSFMMISSLIYHWVYGPSGECNVGYLNDAFVQTALEAPDKFAYIPISDLSPVWSYAQNNHPIHPADKYPAGERLARITIANIYGDGQKTPVTLKEAVPEGNVLKLIFSREGALRIDAGETPHVRGLYVAGANGVYLPGELRITGANTAEARADGIDAPVHAAYNVQSMEPGVNLFGGDYPVAPFFTDRENDLNIEQRPWYDTNRISVWISKLHGDVLDLFFRPIWQPLHGSEVCPDSAFRTGPDASVRVAAEDGNNGEFGACIRSYMYQSLDLYRFAGLSVDLFNMNASEGCLRVITACGTREFSFEPVKNVRLPDGWARFTAGFSGFSAEEPVERMEFVFNREAGEFRFVNIERPRLIQR